VVRGRGKIKGWYKNRGLLYLEFSEEKKRKGKKEKRFAYADQPTRRTK